MKKYIKSILLVLICLYCYTSYAQCDQHTVLTPSIPACGDGVYTLKFEDNFNEDSLDLTK